MHAAIVSSSLALLATVLSGQELLNPGNWLRIAPNYQLYYSNTPGGIWFYPYCVGAHCTQVRTGITQVVQVTTPGLYQFRFAGHGGSSGNFDTQYGVGNLTGGTRSGDWRVTRTLSLAAGPVTIWITTNTSNLSVDHWACGQPSLVPMLAPTVDHDIRDAWSPGNVRVWLRTPGHILAASLSVPAAPIKFPGLSHGLDLSPGNMVILGVSASGGLLVDLSWAASSFGQKTWPTIYLQAVSPTGFGSRSWF